MCFSLGWFEQLLIWLVVVAAVVMILRVLLGWLGATIWPPLAQIINIFIWAAIAIFVIYLAFALIACLLSGPGLPLLPHR